MSERNIASTKNIREIKMKGEMKVDLDRKLVENNARLVECNLELAEHNHRLTENHDEEEDVNLLLEEEDYVKLILERYSTSYIGATIECVIIACGTGILGYFGGGDVMTIKNIITVGRIGVISYCVGSVMSRQ